MSPITLARRITVCRSFLRIVLFAGVATLTGWATFTSYSAKLEKANAQANQPPNASRVPQKRAQDESRAKLDKHYGKLPLSFEVNRGQADASVKYVARGPGYNIFLTSTEAALVFQHDRNGSKQTSGETEKADGPASSDEAEPLSHFERLLERAENQRTSKKVTTVVRMRLEGANTQPRAIESLEELPGKVNYLLGTDSSQWRTDISTYGKVAYRDVYSGIDLVYYGNQQQLEYDLVVAPGADPGLIQIKFDGAEGLRTDKQGNLILNTAAGELRQGKPGIFQEVNGSRKQVDGNYVVKPGNKIGFKVSRYDRRKPLVIDPILSYLSLVNTRGRGMAIAVDASGFAYITGSIDPGDGLPATPGAFQIAGGGGQDVFVTKINQAGTSALYSTYLGGPGDDDAYAIALDPNGNAYITGYATPGFPTTPGSFKTTLAAGFDAFVSKLNPTGSGLVYSTFFGGLNYEECDGIVVDAAGNAIVGGITESSDLPTTAGAVQTANGGGTDGFVAQFNPSGSSLLYATYIGGGGFDFGLNVARDSSNNIYFVAQSGSLDLPSSLQAPSGTDRGLFKSTSGGGSWNLSRTGLTTGFVNALAVAPSSTGILYAGAHGGVSKSTNGGANWSPTGTIAGGNVVALAVDPTNPNIVYAGSAYGVFKSTNGGTSWTAMNNGLTFPAQSGGPIPFLVRGLAIDRNAPTTVYAAANGSMFKTIDGGAGWTQINTGLTNLAMRNVLIDPTNSATVYAVSNTRVYKSTNSGANWATIITGLPGVNTYRALAIDPISPATLYVGGGSGVFKTTNGGTNWSAVNNNLLLPFTDNVGRLPFVVSLAVDPVTPTTLYVGAANAATATGAFPLAAVLKSTDGGANWTSQTTGFNGVNSSVSTLAVDPTSPATIYAGSGGDSEAFIMKLTPGNPTPLFSSYVGGSRGDAVLGLTLDGSGNAYISGRTNSSNFPVTPGAFQTVLRGASDAFVVKFGTNNLPVFATYLGGNSVEDSQGIAVDQTGNIYVTGRTVSADFPTTAGSFQTKIGNPGDATRGDLFVTKLNPAGNALGYSSYLGGGGDEAINPFNLQLLNAIALDGSDNAYVVGITNDPNTFPAADFVNVNNTFGANVTFVAKISSTTASFSITGRLLTPTNTPIAGANVFVDGPTSSFGVSDSQGFYSIINLRAGDYLVTPSRFDGSGRHYLYAPPTQTFVNLNADQVANFTGTQVFDIQGNISSSTVPGLPVFDVTVTLSGSAAATTVTDANGNYSLNDLLPGNYTVTPTKPGFTFNPVNRSFLSLSADQFGANFTTASAPLFTVSGKVADASNTGIGGVTISMLLLPLRGSRVVTTQTDGSGNYSFANLQAGGNYTFTAVKPVLSFSPQSPTLSNLAGNQTLNFLSSQPTGLMGTLAFVKESAQINLINPDGTGEQNLITGTTQCSGGDGLSWSPDGAKLAFSQCVDDTTADLYSVNANGSGLQKITNAPFLNVLPNWSPDGTRLTFSYGQCSGAEGQETIPEVYAIDAAGTNRSRLTNNSVFDAFSSWSPGGSTIAFSRGLTSDCSSGEGTEIYEMDTDGANQRKLTNTIPGGFSPAYSPDGFRVAYLRETFDAVTQVFSRDLYVMNSDGTEQTKITAGLTLFDSAGPTWSPDGTKIAFAGQVQGPFAPDQLFIVNADGTGLAQVTNSAQFISGPAWRHFSISGHVTGIPTDVPVTIALAGTLTRVTQTDKNGNYVFGNLAPGGNYSVSPVSSAFGFNPAKTDISNLSGNQIANFTVLPAVIPAPTPPLADDFGGAQRDPTKWNLGTQTQPLGAFDPAVSVVQENGRLIITPRTGVDELHYNGYVALNSFDFNNGTATVEVVQTAVGGADTIFAIGSDLDNFSRFVVRAGAGEPGRFRPAYGKRKLTDVAQLIFQVRVGGELTSLSIPYDPVQHRFMRFRHQPPNNSIAFETSPDNIAFTVQKEVVLQKSVSALTAELSAGTSSPTNPGQTVFDNFNLVTNTFQFEASSSSVNEGAGSKEVFVTRSGSVSSPATVEYLSFDDSAQQRSKYVLATGTLSFAPGETTKSFRVLVIDNNLVDGDRTLFLQLTDSLGAGLNSPGREGLTIVDNDSTNPTSNPLDNSNADFFVRQHYYDFLSRVPDQSGLDFWTHEITVCGTDQGCIDFKRVNVSAAYFLSIEFQQTGYLVHRFYNASLDRANGLPRYLEFVRDTQTIGRGVVVGAPGWEAQLEANKVAYAEEFVAQPEFRSLYAATLTPAQFVDALYAHAHIVPDAAERQAAIDEFNVPAGARGRALRRVVENPTLYAREFNRAFVLAQYFGYLRRNPDDPPDNNLDGFNFWLGKLNQFNGDFVAAEMVKAFILSGEYRGRFGP